MSGKLWACSMSRRLYVEPGTMGLKIWPKNLMLASHRETRRESGRWGMGVGTLSHAENSYVSVIAFIS